MRRLDLQLPLGKRPGWNVGWIDCSREMYSVCTCDADGYSLHGDYDYVVRFETDRLPPALHWRLSLYDLNGFFCDNEISRYGIGNVANGFVLDRDDSLTIYIQHFSPGLMRYPNWLPSPSAQFFLLFNLSGLDERARCSNYRIPPPMKVRSGAML